MLPVILTHVWLMKELVVSVTYVRRTMIEEERKRRIALRRISSRQRNVSPSRPRTPPSPMAPAYKTPSDDQGGAPTAPSLLKTESVVTAKKALGATMAAGTVSLAATSDSAGSVADSPVQSPVSQRNVGGGSSSSAGRRGRGITWPPPGGGGGGGGGNNSEGEIKADKKLEMTNESKRKDEASYTPPSPLPVEKLPAGSSTVSGSPSLPPQRERPYEWPENTDGMIAVSVRAVRISYLLQAWVRLWLTMSAFAIVAAVLMILLFLRFVGVSSKSLPSSAIASPAIIALSALAVHSFLILDGDGGTAGGPVIRAGGRRSSLALGRRPIIILALVGAAILSAKLDAEDVINAGGTPPWFQATCNRLSYAAVFTPLWIAAALVEGIYLRALWENRTGRSCISFILRSDEEGDWGWATPCVRWCSRCLSLCGDGGNNSTQDSAVPGGGGSRRTRGGIDPYGNRRPSSRRVKGRTGDRHNRRVSFYSAARRRAVLTASQRAAAAAIAGGILFMLIAMVGLSLRRGMTHTPSWAVPMTILVAALAEGLIGAGLWRLANAHCRAMRGGVPPSAKPLPVLYNEREGGWVVGTAERPTANIFLLGDVLLKQEGYVGGAGLGGGDGRRGDEVGQRFRGWGAPSN